MTMGRRPLEKSPSAVGGIVIEEEEKDKKHISGRQNMTIRFCRPKGKSQGKRVTCKQRNCDPGMNQTHLTMGPIRSRVEEYPILSAEEGRMTVGELTKGVSRGSGVNCGSTGGPNR